MKIREIKGIARAIKGRLILLFTHLLLEQN